MPSEPSVDIWKRPPAVTRASLPSHLSGFRSDIPVWSELVSSRHGHRASAVAFLFVQPREEGAPAPLLLTRRTTTVGSHKGQIGFAGGRREEGDETPVDTALREANEELELPLEQTVVHGVLVPQSALEGSPVYPVVMTAAIHPIDLRPDIREVEHIIPEPWPAFSHDRDEPFRFNMFGIWRRSHLFRVGAHNVWGLTARMLFDADLR